MSRWPLICEFCYRQHHETEWPAGWDLVWQSAVCPECQRRVAADGGYGVVKGGSYATTPDPRPWPDADAIPEAQP